MTAPLPKLRLYAAGSLRAALTDVAAFFAAQSGHQVEAKYGPSGLLNDAIAGGAGADLFAAANMDYPRALNRTGKGGPVFRFARNHLCALVRPGLDVDSAHLVARMLDPAVKLGTSTPCSDPSGDYAFAVFRKLDDLEPGAGAVLRSKARMLTGSADSAVPPAGRSAYGWHIAEGRADIFLVYRTAGAEAQRQYPGQHIVELPPALAVAADFGLTVIAGAPPSAQQLADFILSPAGQDVLVGYGFQSGTTER